MKDLSICYEQVSPYQNVANYRFYLNKCCVGYYNRLSNIIKGYYSVLFLYDKGGYPKSKLDLDRI